jgi:polyhydroxyalkanoate synthesis regulator phasin
VIAKGKLTDKETQLLILAALNEQKSALTALVESQDRRFKEVCNNQALIQKNIAAALDEIKNLRLDLIRKNMI